MGPVQRVTSEWLSHSVLINVFVTHSSGWLAWAAFSVHTGGSALEAGRGFFVAGTSQGQESAYGMGQQHYHKACFCPAHLLGYPTRCYKAQYTQTLKWLLHHSVFLTVMLTFGFHRVDSGRIQERDLQVWPGEFGGGQMAVRILFSFDGGRILKGCSDISWLHSQTPCRFSKLNTKTDTCQ